MKQMKVAILNYTFSHLSAYVLNRLLREKLEIHPIHCNFFVVKDFSVM